MAVERNVSDVVISGMSGSFPKCENVDTFKEKLLNNEDLLGNRWREGERGVSNRIGVIPTNALDATYFGILHNQALYMDPMYRISMERTYEAVLDAGINPAELRGKRVALYAAATIGENDSLFTTIAHPFSLTGHSRSLLSNRISYFMNLKGPSCTYDNNWLGGVTVLEAAYEVIKRGQCEAAIVLTTNCAINSEIAWLFNEMGYLSPDGLTRSFDANANGYGRCDAVIAFFIQPAGVAKRSYATILGTKFSYDGYRDGLFRNVNTNSMSNFIKGFYDDCEVNPADVEYVECYGCGLKDYDEAELEAIDKVYCKNRKDPLLIGSVKTNTGHAETSSVFMSIVKVLFAFETGVIPANYNFNSPNPNINGLMQGRMQVVNKNKEHDLKIAAINAVGLSSSYGHVLLKANSKGRVIKDDLPRLLTVCSRTEDGIKTALSQLTTQGKVDPEYACLVQNSYNGSLPRHTYRGYALVGMEEPKSKFQYYSETKPPVWFVYSGMGSQWCKMATDLMVLPMFAEDIRKFHKVLKPKGIDLIHIVTGDDEKMFDNILHSFVGIAAIQIALTDILHALGITPDGIIGHSVGELGCAYADGCLSAEEMILCAYSRGKASLEAELINGTMAAIGLGYEQIKNELPSSIEVACHNSPQSSTISGPTKDMKEFVKKLNKREIFARLVNVSNIAYHSKYIKPVAPLLLKYLKDIIPQPVPRSAKWISTSVPEAEWDTDIAKTSSAEYHTNNLLNAVLFEEGTRHIPPKAVVIEISPHGLLQAILKRSLQKCINVPLTHRASKNGLEFFLEALGKIYLAGIEMNLSSIYPKIDYPVGRGIKSITPLIRWNHTESWVTSMELKVHISSSNIRNLQISSKKDKYESLSGHQLQHINVIPTSFYLGVLYDILCAIRETSTIKAVFENVMFKNVCVIPKTGYVNVVISFQKGNGDFEIMSDAELVATGTVKGAENDLFADVSVIEMDCNNNIMKTKPLLLNDSDVYNEFYHRKHNYSGNYRLIKNLNLTEKGSVSTITRGDNWQDIIEAMIQQYLFHEGELDQDTLVVTSIQRIALSVSEISTESAELQATHNYPSKIISTKGIQIRGLTAKPLDSLNTKILPISYEYIKMVQLSNVNDEQDMETVINMSLKMCVENYRNPATQKTMAIEIQTENPFLESNIDNVINKNPHLKIVVSSVKNLKEIVFLPGQPLFLIMNHIADKECIDFVILTNAFLLARTDAHLLCNRNIVEMANFVVNDIHYSLIRKFPDTVPIVMPIQVNSLRFEDFLHGDLLWTTRIKSIAKLEKRKRIYLVFKVIPFEGIYNFMRRTYSLPNMENVRFVFILDKNAPKFRINEPLYQQVFKNDLILTVIKNDSINTYVTLPREFEENRIHSSGSCCNKIDDTLIKYIGINARDETLTQGFNDFNLVLECMDYSGITSADNRVMGLAHLDSKFGRLIIDPILRWEIPTGLTLEDAATIPYGYALVYYSLVIKAKANPSDTVLIHNGCTPIGLAAIFVARRIGCTVLTTVTSDMQIVFLKRNFIFMNDQTIFNACNTSFEADVLSATRGFGADIILNCLSGSKIDATLRCIAPFGRFVQLGALDLEENKKIGMRVFLNNVNFLIVLIEDILKSAIDVKQAVHEYVAKGLNSYTVRPIPIEVTEHEDINVALRSAKRSERIGKLLVKLSNNLKLNQLKIGSKNRYVCDPSSSYLIYGGHTETWMDVLEWLVFRGAKKIIVSSGSKPEEGHINHRLKLYRTYYNADIVFSSVISYEEQTIYPLISEVYRVSPIAAVFILPNKYSESKDITNKIVQQINSALQKIAPEAIMIDFTDGTTGVCQLRNEAGFLAYSIHWEKTIDFSNVLQALDDTLNSNIKDIWVKDEKYKTDKQEAPKSLYKKLSLLLPSIKEINDDVLQAPAEPGFVNISSLSSSKVKEVPPVFIISEMFRGHIVQDLASKLLYPTYCASFPISYLTLKELAAALAEKIKQICPKGPYNLIGVSYSGLLAIEITKLLAKGKSRTFLQLLDGAPDTVQGILQHLGDEITSDIGFLCRVLNIRDIEVAKELHKTVDWETRLNLGLAHHRFMQENENALRIALTTLKKHLAEVCSFQPSEDLMSGPICLLRPKGSNKEDYCGIYKYCQQEPKIHIIDGSHTSIAQEKITANIINYNTIT